MTKRDARDFVVPDDRGGKQLKAIALKMGKTRSKPFQCVETNKVYQTSLQAAADLTDSSGANLDPGNISRALRNGWKTGGYSFCDLEHKNLVGEIWEDPKDRRSWIIDKR